MSDATGFETDGLEAEDALPSSRLATWILCAVFAILYAYPLFEGISNLIAVPAVYDASGIGGRVPWFLLIVGVAVPIILFVAALLIGRRRDIFPRALLLATGLAATNALFFSVVEWAAKL